MYIFSELIGICDTIPTPSTCTFLTIYIDNREMLQDSRGTLAVNRRIKSWLKAPAYERFYVSHSALAQPYTYLPIEAYDGDVGGNVVKLKRQRNPLIERTKVCSMNWLCFHRKGRVFVMC